MAAGKEKFKTWFLVALLFLFNPTVRTLKMRVGFTLVPREIWKLYPRLCACQVYWQLPKLERGCFPNIIITEFTLAKSTEMNPTRRQVPSLITEKFAVSDIKVSKMFINLRIFAFTLEGYQIWLQRSREIQDSISTVSVIPKFSLDRPTQFSPLWELNWQYFWLFYPFIWMNKAKLCFVMLGLWGSLLFNWLLFFHHHSSQALPYLNYARDGIIMRDGLIFHYISSWSQCNTQSSLVHLAGNPISEADFKLPAQLNFHA